MFTLRQITCAGLFGVYGGCVTLTVNLARLPYWRGAFIGVAFGALTHVLATLLHIFVATSAGRLLGDDILKQNTTWIVVGLLVVCIQVSAAWGCRIMGRYFHAPNDRASSFDRNALLDRLRRIDTGKPSVLHDVVLKLENVQPPAATRFSNAWIALFALLSVAAAFAWIRLLTVATLESILYRIPIDFYWYLGVFLRCLAPFAVLVIVHLAVLAFLGTRAVRPVPPNF